MTRQSHVAEAVGSLPGEADGIPGPLARAVAAWVGGRGPSPLLRWLERQVDPEGVPRRLPVSAWGPCLATLAEAFRARPDGWPAVGTARIEGFFRTALRCRRPDGSAVFGPEGSAEAAGWLHFWADRLPDPGLRAVVRRWFPTSRDRGRAPGIPFLPAFGARGRPLAMLRPDWTTRGDFLAIDQYDQAGPCLLELVGQGRRWLGPSWTSDSTAGPRSPARSSSWSSGPLADVAEWSFRTPSARHVRTAVLLRGRQLALLAEQINGAGPAPTLSLAPGPGIQPLPLADSRALALTSGAGGRGSARIIPLGLPARPYPTERGSFGFDDGQLVLRQARTGRRCWLPLLVSWGADLNRRPAFWRTLTVTERSRVCPPEVAFAARVAWGAGEGLLIYRSLARPALRAVLGYQTKARFLIGRFTRAGDVVPIVTIES